MTMTSVVCSISKGDKSIQGSTHRHWLLWLMIMFHTNWKLALSFLFPKLNKMFLEDRLHWWKKRVCFLFLLSTLLVSQTEYANIRVGMSVNINTKEKSPYNARVPNHDFFLNRKLQRNIRSIWKCDKFK